MKKKLLRKPLAVIIAFAMIFTFSASLTTFVFADSEKPVKFSVEVSSQYGEGKEGIVKGEVYSDYTGKLTITGDYVNSSNATITVTMSDVASLGVSGTRTYTREMKFNSSSKVPMNNVTQLFNKLDGTYIDCTFAGESVGYKVSGKDGNYDLKPTSSKDAAKVWHALVNDDNFEYGVKDEDSYIIIGNGSWLKSGNSILEFEADCTENLTLDNFGDLNNLNNNIRGHVALNTTEDTTEGVAFYLTKGTELALGSSYAKLKEPAAFDFAIENYAAIEDSLKNLREMTGDTTDMMKTLFGILDTTFTAIGGEVIKAQGTIGDIPENVPVNKQKLADAVKEAVNKLGEDTYTADSFKAMIAAINEGISILADENATQETIDNACANVLDVMSKLTKKDGGNTNPTSAAGLKAGDEFVVKGNTYRVISPEKLTVAFVKAKNAKSVTVPATVIKGNKFKVIQISSKAFKAKKIKTVTIGKNIAKIKKNAFKGSKAKKINLKTKRLKKNSIKGCLKGSKVKSIKVKISKKKSTNKKYINKYKKIFTKKNAGRKVKVY